MLSIACRAAETYGGAQIDSGRGPGLASWEHAPRKFKTFTWFEVCSGGSFFVHAYTTYIPASCRLRLAVSENHDVQGLSGLRSIASHVGLLNFNLRQDKHDNAKQKSRLAYHLNKSSIVWASLLWGLGTNCHCAPPPAALIV